MPLATFKISGDWATEFYRTRVLEGDWEVALKNLVDSFEGMTYDIAMDILSGKMKLTGPMEEIELVDEDGSVGEDYERRVLWVYGAYVRVGEHWFRPYAYVSSYGMADIGSGTIRKKTTDYISYYDGRERYYFNNSRDISIFMKLRQFLPHLYNHEYGVLFEQVGPPPLWLPVNHDPVKSVGFQVRHGAGLEERGAMADHTLDVTRVVTSSAVRCEVPEVVGSESTTSQAESLERWRSIIARQADALGGWFDLEFQGVTYKVPYAPFEVWALKDTHGAHLALKWQPVCPQGLKRGADCQYHTDFIVGAGIDLGDAYGDGLSDLLYQKMWRLQEEKLGFECGVLSRSPRAGVSEGDVIFPKQDSEDIPPGAILVIPHAGPEYLIPALMVARYGGAIITERGGALSHLVQVGNERGVNIVLVENARKLYPEGSNVRVDTTAGTVTLSKVRC